MKMFQVKKERDSVQEIKKSHVTEEKNCQEMKTGEGRKQHNLGSLT